MTKSLLSVWVVAMLLFGFVGPTWADEAALIVEDPAICLDVVNRACVDPNDVFPAGVGKLFCNTKIVGAQEPVSVIHVWMFGDVERARVPLAIRSERFRTFSSKRIQPHEVGDWRVDVLGPDETILTSITFETVP